MGKGTNKPTVNTKGRSIKDLTVFVQGLDKNNEISNNEINKETEVEKTAPTTVSLSEKIAPQEREVVAENPEVNIENVADIETLFQYVNEQRYKKEPGVYVDGDIREYLADLKKYTGVNIGNLVSFILEQWIETNKEALKEVMGAKKRKNRFLD